MVLKSMFIKVSIFLLLVACGRLNEFEHRVAKDEALNVGGLMELTESEELDRVNVLLIHGMGGFANRDEITLPDEVAESLNFSTDSCKSRQVYIGSSGITRPKGYSDCGKNVNIDDSSNIDGRVVTREYTRADGKQLNFFNVFWSNSVTSEKFYLQAVDMQNWIQDLRVRRYTDIAKYRLMNDNLADALLYTGNKRQEIDRVASLSANWIASDSRGTRHANSIVSFSLGSAIVNNALGFTNRKQSNDFNNKLCRVYMLANQIPLLELGSDTPGTLRTRYEKMPGVESGLRPQCNSSGRQWIVSISDPNDVLSYPLESDVFYSDLAKAYADVALSITKWKYGVGDIQFVNPIEAHLGYAQDERVIKLISVGGSNF